MFPVNVLAIAPVGWSCDEGEGVSLFYQQHIKVMQYTGLKDINGKELYEGDLCKEVDEEGKETGFLLQILWSENYQFCANVIKGGVLSRGLSFPLWQWDKCKGNAYRQLEIIGNIYEDSEFLNVYVTAKDEDVKEAIERCNKKHEKTLKRLEEN